MKSFKEPLGPQEEREYLERLMKGDKEAKDILIERNLRLVAHIVKKYATDESDVEDLISVGTIGLIKAINTFKADKGNKLGTYAAKCIENELLMMFRSEKKRNRDVSLNEPIGTDKEGNSISLMDVIEEEQKDIIDEMEMREDTVKLFRYIDEVLSEKEKDIILKRYGLRGNKARTQKLIGEEYGISRSYVSRIEKRALGKLREAFSLDGKS